MRLKETGTTACLPNESVTVIEVAVLPPPVSGAVAVNVPLPDAGETVTSDAFWLVAVNVPL